MSEEANQTQTEVSPNEAARKVVEDTARATCTRFLSLLKASLNNNINKGVTQEMACGILTVVEHSMNEFLASMQNESIRKRDPI
jgi:triphosphoribosyl-dephospho-CoA synthetase